MKKTGILIAPLVIILMGFLYPPTEDLTTRIIEGLKQYLRKYPQEKVYLQTDRDHYAAGQTIWMKIYQFQAHYDIPLSLSNVIYVELVNDRDNVVISTKHAAKDGLAHGSLILPVNLEAGHYRLRCYTRWMTNFDHQYIYEKDLYVGTVAALPTPTSLVHSLNFFPESGTLVNNMMSRIVVAAHDLSGRPQAIQGWITDQTQDTLQTFITDAHGLGSFVLRPQSGSLYQAQVLNADSTLSRFNFPEIQLQPQGMTLNVTAAGTTFLRTLIQASPKYQGDSVVVTVLSKGQIYFAAKGQVTDQPLLINFPRKELPDGISTITVFDEDGIAQCQRSVFINQQPSYQVAVSGNENPIGTRQAVSLTFKITDENNTPVNGNFSLKIADANIPNFHDGSLVDFLKVNSELHNPHLSSKLDHQQIQDTKFMDLMMIAQPIKRFAWPDVLADKAPSTPIEMETSGFSLKGQLSAPAGPLTQKTVMLSSQELPELFRWGLSDQEGNFVIRNLMFSGTYPAALKLNDTLIDQNARITLLPHTPPIQKSPAFHGAFRSLEGHPYLEENEIRAQAQQVFKLAQPHRVQPVNRPSTQFYGEVDETVLLDEFIQLPEMEEVFRELLPGVRLRDRDGYPEIRVVEIEEDYFTGDRFTRYQDEGPLMLINNVPVFDPKLIVDLDPAMVSRVDIIYGKRSIFGENVLQEYPFKGILSFTTREPVTQEKELKAIHRFDLQGLQPEIFFNHVDASQIPPHTPDLRDLLYWEPEHTTDDNGQIRVTFHTSDLDSDFYIELQGMTEDGKPLFHREILKVQYTP